MSKLTAFLAKTKQKHADKQGQLPVATQPVLAVTERVAPSPVSLDVVKPKVLEQWNAGEEEELVEEASGVHPTPMRPSGDSDEEDEIDLPSNKVRGNFEWKRKEKEPEPAPVPKAVPGDVPFLIKRNRMHDITDPSLYPELGPRPQETSPTVKNEKKHKKEQNKASRETQPITAERQKEKSVTVDDIYKAVGRWPNGWPRVTFDESASRNRLAKLQLPCKVVQ